MAARDKNGAWRGSTALVTGAASGIGRACCEQLAARGASIIAVDLDRGGLDSLACTLEARGAAVETVCADVSDPPAMDRLADRAPHYFGAIDLLYLNAGISVVAPVHRHERADWHRLAAVNLWAPIELCQRMLPYFRGRGHGHIAVTASLAGLVGSPGMAAYSVTKFGLVGYAETLRAELASTGVTVSAVCPGHVRTEMIEHNEYRDPSWESWLKNPPAWSGVSPEAAARRIVDGFERRRGLILIGADAHLSWWLKRASPELAFHLTRWVARRIGVGAAQR